MNTDNHNIQAGQSWRLGLVISVLAIAVVLICAKVVWLSVQEQEFLQKQGDARSLRVVKDAAQRGIITDRFGTPLAVSAPVKTIWADPRLVDEDSEAFAQLAEILGYDAKSLQQKIAAKKKKHFLYIKRQVEPSLAEQAMALGVDGVFAIQEYKRFYPYTDIVSQLIGFTSVDGEGQEGLERTFNEHMRAEPGKQLIVKDRKGHEVKYIRSEAEAKPGRPLQLTLNMELQYLAYRELKSAVNAHKADSASLVMLDPATGDILAMANYPSFNPNNLKERVSASIRNRAAADTFEPGSTMKPLTVAAALMSGQYAPEAVIDTAPGKLRIQGNVISDHRNYGELDITGIITKSSNVGTAKLALSLEPGALHNMFFNVGLGRPTGVGISSEQAGRLPFLSDGQRIQRAAMSYGYGLSVTALQLAQAYLPLANGGWTMPVNLLYSEAEREKRRVMPEGVAKNVLAMMETVVSVKGTARQAAVQGFRVAGKTGTVHKVGTHGYLEDQYTSVFAGVAPASKPKVITVVMVDNPQNQEYYGGEVAAPIFSRVMGDSLRILNVVPDDMEFRNGQALKVVRNDK